MIAGPRSWRPSQQPRDREIILSPKDYLPLLLSLVFSLIVVSHVIRLNTLQTFRFRPTSISHLSVFCRAGGLSFPPSHLSDYTLRRPVRLSRRLRAHFSPLALAYASRQPPSLCPVRTSCSFTPWSPSPFQHAAGAPRPSPTHLIDQSDDSTAVHVHPPPRPL